MRLVPASPRTMFALGSKPGLEETALNVRLAAGVSASRIVNGMAAVGVSSVVT